MKKFIFMITLALFACSKKAPEPAQETASVPERIISLAPNLTEVVVELGLGDRIIANTRFDRDTIGERKLEKVGGIMDPSVERMVSLKPDLVLLHWDGPPPVFVAQLESVGIAVYSCGIKNLSEMKTCVSGLGERLEVGEATTRLLNSMAELFETPKPLSDESPTIMLVLNESPLIAAARNSFPAQVARLAGWRTLPGGDGPDYPRLSLEQLAAARPTLTLDLVMGAEHKPEAFKERMKVALGDLAVKHMNPDTILRPGPQLIEGLKILKKLRAEIGP